MIVTNLRFTTDLDRGLVMTPLANAFMSGDDEAHKFVVSCYSGLTRAAFDLTGAVVTGYFVRADGSTVIVEGDVSNNAANVLLPAECYAVPGRFSLVIKAARGSSVHSLLWAQGAVSRSHTDAVLDPGQVLPSLDELMAKIGLLEQTTAAAQAVVNMTAEATTLPAGSAATASYANGKLSLGIPKGQDSDTALPTGYKPFDMLVIGPDGKPRWEERTHYDYSGTVLPLTDLKVIGGHHTFDAPLDAMPVVGVPYRVTYQGTEYTVTAKPYVDEGKDCVILGNQRDLGSGENTKEPFIMLFYPPETVTNNYYGFLSCDATSVSTVSLGIEGEGELKKIDPKFLPEGTGNGGGGMLPTGGEPYKQLVTDGEGNAVWEDRLAYETEPETFFEHTFAMDEYVEGTFALLGVSLNLVAGEEYGVTWDGISYTCIARDFVVNGMSMGIYLGDATLVAPDLAGNNEPFLFIYAPLDTSIMLMPLDGVPADMTLKLAAPGIVKINPKYLPQGDIVLPQLELDLNNMADHDADTKQVYLEDSQNAEWLAKCQSGIVQVKLLNLGGLSSCTLAFPMSYYNNDGASMIFYGKSWALHDEENGTPTEYSLTYNFSRNSVMLKIV